MQKETQDYVRKCDQYQRFVPGIHQPGGMLNPLSSSWSFAQYGLNIVGPFPRALGNQRWLLVGIDHFTKWVKAEPLSNIRDVDVKSLYERTLLPDLGFHTPLSRIMGSSLIARLSGGIVGS